MYFVIGRDFVKVKILIKVKLALLNIRNGSIKVCIRIDSEKLQYNALPIVKFHTIWSRLSRGQNSYKNKH